MDDVRVEAVRPRVAGPDEVFTRDVEIALGQLPVVVGAVAVAAGRVEIGHVVEVELEATTADIVVRVADRGPGIPPADLPHIFDRFYKGEGSTGSGLGLTIARNLVAAHGGTVAARARAGGGTIVEFTLPRLSTSD